MSKELPVAHAFEGGTIGYMELYAIASRSPWGKILSEQSRWRTYQPPDFSLREWEEILGRDVNNRDHLKLTYGIDRWFLRNCESPPPDWLGPVSEAADFPPDEQSLLLLTAPFHDLAEAITDDKPGPDKIAEDSELEWKYLHTITEKLTKDIPQLQADLDFVIEHILRDTSTKLGRAFRAIELLGYHMTALRAWRQSENTDIVTANWDNGLILRLRALSFSVFTHNMGEVIESASVYPAMQGYLVANRDLISHIFATPSGVAAQTLRTYNNHRSLEELAGKYTANRDRWYHWLYTRHTPFQG